MRVLLPTRKAQENQALDGTMFYLQREETQQDQPQQWALVSHGQWVLPGSQHRAIGPLVV